MTFYYDPRVNEKYVNLSIALALLFTRSKTVWGFFVTKKKKALNNKIELLFFLVFWYYSGNLIIRIVWEWIKSSN